MTNDISTVMYWFLRGHQRDAIDTPFQHLVDIAIKEGYLEYKPEYLFPTEKAYQRYGSKPDFE